MMYQPRRPLTHDTVQLRQLQFHLYRWPAGSAPLVLLHGWGDSGETFQFLVDALAPQRTCIAPDQRGFGRTQWPQHGYWFADYLADLDALLEQLSPQEPVDLLGHSMGGNVAMLYAGIRPERVRRVINLDGPGLSPTDPAQAPTRYREWLAEVRGGPRDFGVYPNFERLEWLLSKRNPRTPAERIAFIARAWAHEAEPGRIVLRTDPRHKWVNPVLYRRPEAEACWREIQAPVLFVIGAESDVLRRLKIDPARCIDGIPHARLQVLDGAGHMLHHEQPERVAQLIEEFLAAT